MRKITSIINLKENESKQEMEEQFIRMIKDNGFNLRRTSYGIEIIFAPDVKIEVTFSNDGVKYHSYTKQTFFLKNNFEELEKMFWYDVKEIKKFL